MKPTQIIEALLFASEAPLTTADMACADETLDEATVEAAIHELKREYEESGRAFQIYEMAGGFQVLTRPDFAPYLERFDTVVHTARLSTAALEVLAIIAYRQPIGRAEIEEIRGVGSSGVLRTLQERELITPVGRGEGLGRPLLYGTTSRFLEHFGFRGLEDLPRPEELPVVLRERHAGEVEEKGDENGAAPGHANGTSATSGSAAAADDAQDAGDAGDADSPNDEPVERHAAVVDASADADAGGLANGDVGTEYNADADGLAPGQPDGPGSNGSGPGHASPPAHEDD